MAPIELLQKKKIGGKDVKRDRVLSIVELADLVTQLPPANLHKGTVLGLWLILSTGCRVGELMGAVWVDANPSRLQRTGVKRAFAIPRNCIRNGVPARPPYCRAVGCVPRWSSQSSSHVIVDAPTR